MSYDMPLNTEIKLRDKTGIGSVSDNQPIMFFFLDWHNTSIVLVHSRCLNTFGKIVIHPLKCRTVSLQSHSNFKLGLLKMIIY